MHADHHEELVTRLLHMNTQVLAPWARYAHVALLLAATGMSVLIAALLATEPALPRHTQMAFCAMLAVGLAWMGYAVWVLRQRRPLFARHRVVAGRMAVGFNAGFFAVAITAFAINGASLARNAAVTGAVLLVLAVATLVRATLDASRLAAVRQALEQGVGTSQ